MLRRLAASLIVFVVLGLTACGQGQPERPNIPPDIPSEARALAERAMVDLAERKDVPVDEIVLRSVEATEFPDASLGVPEPGEAYAQVITPGYVILLEHDGETYEYRAAENRVVMVPEE